MKKILLGILVGAMVFAGSVHGTELRTIVGRWGSSSGETDDVRIDASTNSLQTISYEHHEIHSGSHYFTEGHLELSDTEELDFMVTTDSGTAYPHVVFNFESDLELHFEFYELPTFGAGGTHITQFANNRAKAFSGTHTAAGNNATVMTDSTASFTIDALIGWKIHNITDASYGIVTDNDGTTVTVTSLTSGTDNDWDTADQYEINKSLTDVRYEIDGATVTATGILLGSTVGGSGTTPNKGIPGGDTRENEIVLRANTKYLWRFVSGANSNTFAYRAEWYEHTDKHN